MEGKEEEERKKVTSRSTEELVLKKLSVVKKWYFLWGLPCIGGVGTTSHPAASPLPVQRLQLEEFNGGGGSPMSQRSGFMRRESHVLADISEVDTLDSTAMTDQAVHNISAMFPTVEESHIKDLLKKYVFFSSWN